jgi:PIN domain nuclease of toxin-antitoxin system
LGRVAAIKRLSRRVVKALPDPRNEFGVSPISTWEILVLCHKGRLALNEDAESWIAKAMALAPLHEAPPAHEATLATRALQLPHHDPADRFLAATAKGYRLTLVTADENLARSKSISVLMNRLRRLDYRFAGQASACDILRIAPATAGAQGPREHDGLVVGPGRSRSGQRGCSRCSPPPVSS